jgi:hypothetical protein
VARRFTAASSEFLTASGSPVTAYPLTLSAHFRANNHPGNGAEQCLMAVDASGADALQQIVIRGTSGSAIAIRARTRNTGNAAAQSSTTTTADAAWHHAAGGFASATSRLAYLDGGAAGSNTTNIAFNAGINRVDIGVERYNAISPVNYLNNDLAEAAIWSTDLTATEIAILARGVSPLLVRPTALVFYAPILGRYSPEPDVRGGLSLTVTGTTVADHGRVFYPRRAGLIAVPDAAGAAFLPRPNPVIGQAIVRSNYH